MKKVVALTLLAALCFPVLISSAQDLKPEPGKLVPSSSSFKLNDDDEATEIRYFVFVPENYDGEKKLPLMLFLHGAGERGDDLEVVKKWGPPKIASSDSSFPFILISPQCPKEQRWNPKLLAHLVDEVAGELSVDKSRMYCTGLSMGGYGTWAMLAEYPNLFAAAIPVCGGGDPNSVRKFTHVPVWAFHGDADETVPVERSQQMVEAIKAAGGSVKYTEYEGVGHNSWSQAYSTKEIYSWLMEHERKSNQ